MKIAIPSDSKQSLGGGFTFRRNLIQALGSDFTESIREADVVLIPSSTMIVPETFNAIKGLNKKVVLRIDNIPRNSRNRNTGTSRLLKYAGESDAIVFQSEWARKYLSPFLKRTGSIIYNGVDTSIFNKHGDSYNFGYPTYLFSRFNRDETKRWEKAWYEFQMIHRRTPESKLKIVGNFSQEQIDYNFDFYSGENVEYLGVVDDPKEMAKIYRGCQFFLATYYNDAYSNTYCEAMACGVQLFQPSMTGGTPEIIENFGKGVRSIQDMAQDYLSLFKSL